MKRLSFWFSLCLLLTGCGSFLGSQPRPEQLNFPQLQLNFPQVSQQQLPNGMRYYLLEDQELPLVELTMMVEGGSIYDSADQTGLSQFFAAVLQTGGTEKLSSAALEAELEQLAAELSVSSSSYCYEIHMSFHRDDLPHMLSILAELLRTPGFDQERVTIARQQMLEGIYRRNDEPDAVAGRLLAGAVYPGHPFGSSPSIAEVKGFTRNDLQQLHQRYFHPGNLWLAVSGDVEAVELQQLLHREFGSWPTSPSLLRDFPVLPKSEPPQVQVVDKEIPQTSIKMGHVGISKDNPDAMALRLANYILGGGGFNSRLMREVRSNRGLAYSVYSYFQVGRHLPGMFIASSETKGASTVEVVRLMRQEIQKLRDVPVTPEELALAQKSLINSFVFAFENAHSVVSRKARLDFYSYPEDYMESYRERVAAVTIADVQRVARKYLHPEKLQIVLVGDRQLFALDLDEMGLPIRDVEL